MRPMNFFKTFWATLFAFIVGSVIVSTIGVLFIIGIIAFSTVQTPVTVEPNSILKIDFSQNIVESPELSAINSIDFNTFTVNKSLTLLNVLTSLEYASIDDNIDGIYLDLNTSFTLSYAVAEEIRAALMKFKESGKFIVAYSEIYSQGALYLSSVADQIAINPEGTLMWQGLAMNQVFYKGLLDKLGVEPIILRSGSFKAAVEPFVNTQMSAENRYQSQLLLDAIWNTMLEGISDSRDIEVKKLQQYASELSIVKSADALKLKMVDKLAYFDEVQNELRSLTGQYADEDTRLVRLADYATQVDLSIKSSDNKIAVVYLDGEIVSGKSTEGIVGSETIRKRIAQLREDDDVKALVLRVNSPGGSALAAEVMWREIDLLKEQIPVVVSMGEMAASGGYYVAAPADVIFANKMTITGSIGVFGLLFNAQKGLKDKLGITTDVVSTNPSADMGSAFRSPSRAEIAYGTRQVENVYDTFVSHVAQGRNMSVEAVDKIAQGRVWSGLDASEIGLVDGLGGLTEAILLAADRASLGDDFEVYEVVDSEDAFTALLTSLGVSIRNMKLKSKLEESFEAYQRVQTILKTEGVQAISPYIYEIQ